MAARVAALIEGRLGGYLAGPGSVVDSQPYIIERAALIRDLPRWLTAMLSRYTERLQRQAASPPACTGIYHGGISPWD